MYTTTNIPITDDGTTTVMFADDTTILSANDSQLETAKRFGPSLKMDDEMANKIQQA